MRRQWDYSSTIPRGAAMAGKYTIVVDDDIDPSNWDEVAWAISSRVDPETQIEILRGHLNTPLDPAVTPEKRARQDYTMAGSLSMPADRITGEMSSRRLSPTQRSLRNR